TPAAANAAPLKPPTSAWVALEGNPKYHVVTFQTICEITIASSTFKLMEFGSKKSRPMVAAIAEPNKKGPINSKMTARAIARRGASERVEIGAATSVPELLNPMKNAYSSIRPRKMPSAGVTVILTVIQFDC